ncbi:MAG: TetR/AcrR family transcriptional regulator [Betaproteobacteria bacterium]|nr:TetR/AcrR family transcriptional regulator [Betaproteobacteria bacterium]NDE26100.1 TetR/AcrR family transcriptional regulator [Betaproteobacteria bacterium]NDF79143.1 TetR/AcrR family transcriptional regulator [Betaproteobacteria bacterium]
MTSEPTSPPNTLLDPLTDKPMDPVKRNILEVALAEFANYGLEGSRIESIAAGTHTSKRMIYYHFGSKENLYAQVLEFAYRIVREDHIDPPEDLPPIEALARMAGDAFDNFSRYPDFIRLSLQENLQGARFLKLSPTLVQLNRATFAMVQDLVRRGQADGSMRKELDPMNVYINFIGQCHYHISSHFNYKVLFDYDSNLPENSLSRRQAICEAIVCYVRA